MKNKLPLALAMLSLAACESFPSSTPAAVASPASAVAFELSTIEANVLGATGREVGTVKLQQAPQGVLMRVELRAGSLTPGWHGLHLHQVGDCSDTGVYKLSGGHVGKVEGGHGLLNPHGHEGGDTPNIYASSNGSAAMETITSSVTLSELASGDGSALIIHAGPDDHVTQPIGGAGARVACAVISN